MCVWRISKDITYDVYNFICYRRVLLPVWIKLNLLFKRNKFYFKGLKLFFGLIISIQKNHLEKFSAVKSRFFFHCVESVRIRSFSGPCFPVFSSNVGTYGPGKLWIQTLFSVGGPPPPPQYEPLCAGSALNWGTLYYQILEKKGLSHSFISTESDMGIKTIKIVVHAHIYQNYTKLLTSMYFWGSTLWMKSGI